MITIPIEDAIFVLCALVGGGLLLVTVVFDDILGGIFDALHIGFDIGGVSLMPLALSFVAMFGVGGIFATQVLDLHAAGAAAVGVVAGAIGLGLNYGLFTLLRRSEGTRPFSTGDLVGREAFVSVAIPAGRFGTITMRAEGQTHEFAATAAVEIPAGATVRISGLAGSGFMVEPHASTGVASEAPRAPQAPSPSALTDHPSDQGDSHVG
jgi:membrane protein implicated in regulation of membrane protease activity